MKNPCSAILLFVFLIATPRVQARLDETAEQCDARYGKPTEAYDSTEVLGTTVRVYHKGGLQVKIYFLRGKAGDITFTKLDNSDFSAEEIDALLKANQGTAPFQLMADVGGTGRDGKPEKVWSRADGGYGFYAYHNDNYRFVSANTKQFKAYQDAHKTPGQSTPQKAKTLDGF